MHTQYGAITIVVYDFVRISSYTHKHQVTRIKKKFVNEYDMCITLSPLFLIFIIVYYLLTNCIIFKRWTCYTPLLCFPPCEI